MANVNDMVIRQMPWHANMTELNHLGKAMHIKPQVFGSKIDQLFSSYVYSDNSLSQRLIGSGRVEQAESNDWTWTLKGAPVRPLVVMENYSAPGTAKPGQYNAPILLKYDHDDWSPGDIVSPGKPQVQARIQSKVPAQNGNGSIYTLVLYGAKKPSDHLDPKYLVKGAKWNKLFSQYEEGAQEAGSVQFSTDMELKNRLSRYRKRYGITGDAFNTVLAVKMKASNGQPVNTWIRYAEVEYWQQWYRELERGIWYSREDSKVKGSTGRSIYSGPGIQQQLDKSFRHYYSTLTGKLIQEFVMDIVYSRTKPGEKRNFLAITGEYGMMEFNRVALQDLKNLGFVLSDEYFVQRTSGPYHQNSLAVGGQFVEMRLFNGAIMTLMHNPLYDDPTINTEIDPVTGYPSESMRYTFLDVAGEGKNSNINLVKRKNGYKLAYVNGMVSPWGPVVGESSSHDGDYYTMTCQDQRGVHIHDISRCGELILNRA